MKRLPFIALVLFAGAARADDAAAKKLLKELEGTYTPVSMTQSGQPASDGSLKSVTCAIKGDTLTIHFPKAGDHTATLTVDSTQTPTAIDMTPKDGPDA